MRARSPGLIGAVAALVAVAIMQPASNAHASGPSTAVNVVSAVDEGSLARVAGFADYSTFGPTRSPTWPDPVGDATPRFGLGSPVEQPTRDALSDDLVGARITWADASKRVLEFRIDLAHLAEPLTGTPENVLYLWEFGVDAGPRLAIQAMRSSQWLTPGSIDPAFVVISCGPTHSDFAATCSHAASGPGRPRVTGRFDTSPGCPLDPPQTGSVPCLRVFVPFDLAISVYPSARCADGATTRPDGTCSDGSAPMCPTGPPNPDGNCPPSEESIGLHDGAVISKTELIPGHGGGLNVSSRRAVASGATWDFSPLDGLAQTDKFVLPARTVDLAVAAPGTDPATITKWTRASLLDVGDFDGTVDISALPPGSYTAYARACLGPDRCAVGSRPLTVT